MDMERTQHGRSAVLGHAGKAGRVFCAAMLAFTIGACGVGCSNSSTGTGSGSAQQTSTEKPETASGQEEATSLSGLKAGSTFAFGSYQGKSIGWEVLKVDGDKALVIAQEGVDVKKFNDERGKYVWKDSTLRTWMNGDFLDSAFSSEQKAKIATTSVANEKNPYWDTGGSEATEDKLFCLSITEAEEYFGRDGEAKCYPSDYAASQGAYTDGGGGCCWWLRDGGYDVNAGETAADVNTEGFIFDSGAYVDKDTYCVRPAMWVNMK